VRALIVAANDAGGKDNVTAVFVEGERFAAAVRSGVTSSAARRPVGHQPARPDQGPNSPEPRKLRNGVRIAIVVLLVALVGVALGRERIVPWISKALATGPAAVSAVDPVAGDQTVQPGESISLAVLRANQGTTVFVEAGEYREQVTLREGVRIVSRPPRAATIRLPATATESDAAVIADGVGSGELAGFRIVGDAATPLGTGVHVSAANVSISDVEIVGATKAAVEFSGAGGAFLASEVHDNPGAAMVIRAGGAPRVAHNAFARNGMAQLAGPPFAIEVGARPVFQWNTFSGTGADVFSALDAETRHALAQQNWFVRATSTAQSAAAAARGTRPRPTR
jgi:hypothetical protein